MAQLTVTQRNRLNKVFNSSAIKSTERIADPAFLGGHTAGYTTVALDVLAIPVTHRVVGKTTGGDAEACTLANGIPGQRLTIILVTDGGGDATITPVLATGWATIVLADVKDTITLYYVDDTVGWIVEGAEGVAAPPVIS